MTVYKYTAATLAGEEVGLENWRGRVLLIVNTASECGFTPQYAGLETLYRKLEPQGLTVLGFPCNQFGGQEPGGETEIGAFCQKNYGVSFPDVRQGGCQGTARPSAVPVSHPGQKPGFLGTEAIKWNFTKFLIDRDGDPVARFAPQTKPEELEEPIRKLL